MARTGWVQRLRFRNGGVVVIVVELIVRAIEGSVELVIGVFWRPLCGQGSITGGHGGDREESVGVGLGWRCGLPTWRGDRGKDLFLVCRESRRRRIIMVPVRVQSETLIFDLVDSGGVCDR